MGLPGETIEIHDDYVTIDGRALQVSALPRADFSWVPDSHTMGSSLYNEAGHWVAFTPGAGPYRNFPAVHLSSGQYFLLGDNRDVSLDCRAWGPLNEAAISGKVLFAFPTGPRKK